VISDKEFDDIGGNNNGAPDPGETISMILTMSNVGNGTASNIVGTLSTTDPYLTITQNVSYFPDLGHFEQGQGSPAYMMDVSESCPQGESVTCDLHIEADSAYTNDIVISFIVGNPLYDPVGPDAYGYYAYDILDQPEGPVFDWVEIAPAAGGPGTVIGELSGRDDHSTLLDLPFTFQYYGVDYDNLTVCTNGWLAMGNALPDSDWSNSQIPDADGPPNLLAPFWEDMNLETVGQIVSYYDPADSKFIVEFFRVPQWSPATALETFEVILYDPAVYPTATGDGKILYQYYTVADPTACTVGIENADETIGLQYLFDGAYEEHAAPIDSGMAILFTTVSTLPEVVVELTPYGAPIQIPASGGMFSFNVSLTNNESALVSFDAWCDVTLPSGSIYGPVLGPVNLTLPGSGSINRDRNQDVPGGAPAGTYSYNAYAGSYPSIIYSSDSFSFEKLTTGVGAHVTEWNNWGEAFNEGLIANTEKPERFTLHKAYPNPFNPMTAINYQLPEVSFVNLSVYDISGRLVAVLVDGWRDAGRHDVNFDASDLASGVYFYRLEAGQFSASGKMVLMR
ncbi:MAG TPA: T9SS type A sorting domain-containing protein, partial [Bacteroidetes bacterium]|nr:T9SS type A sorting domain-containing protein [Bacteroidota bacterium]